jgi:hypothetical protein
MNLTNLNTGALRNLIKLTERKESLLAEIEKIENQLASLLTGKAVRTTGKRRGRPAKKGKATKVAKAGMSGNLPNCPWHLADSQGLLNCKQHARQCLKQPTASQRPHSSSCGPHLLHERC